ncbi:MAG TPA: HAD-IIIA family hydrolase, partial [Campylobacterales bacterium]|nr:HAD-IIIA family hydrolase [Campylobacterales bacterium]
MNKALFLDRDGVINIDHGYVYKIEKFEFTEGIFDLLRLFLAKGYLLFIVTNQSGIGRDYYSEEDFQKLTAWM